MTDQDDDPEARWVVIATEHQLAPLSAADPVRSNAARVQMPGLAPFIVFGTVLPWLGSSWRGIPSKDGEAFAAALETQLSDWLVLRSQYPDDEFFVMGDFNQDLASSHYYGSKRNRAALQGALAKAGLKAWTAGRQDPVRRASPPCACIDHICGRVDSAWTERASSRWPQAEKPDVGLSDHFGIAVELEG